MGAVNECRKCGKLAPCDPDNVVRMYSGLCSACKPEGATLTREFFAPSNLAASRLFKKQYVDACVDAFLAAAQPPKVGTL